MPRPHNKLDRYLGTRGWILLVCAWVWFLVGMGVLLREAVGGDPSLLHLYIPTELRIVLWWVPAALAVYGAFRKKHLVVVIPALIIAPLIRVASYGLAWITWGLNQAGFAPWLPDDLAGFSGGWYSVSMHLPLVALVLIAAHTREPTRDEVR